MKWPLLTFAAASALAIALLPTACKKEKELNISSCDVLFTCPRGELAFGHSTLSKIASIDNFFRSVVDLSSAMKQAQEDLHVALSALALSQGLDPTSHATEINESIAARTALAQHPGLRFEYVRNACTRDPFIYTRAITQCDLSLDPGADRATCSGDCASVDDDLAAGGASHESDCSDPSVATCYGDVEIPSASATCEAHASIEGSLHATCFPALANIDFNPGDSEADDFGFSAWSYDMNRRLSQLRAQVERARWYLETASRASEHSDGPIRASIEVARNGDISLLTAFGLDCALEQLPQVGTILSDRKGELAPLVEQASAILERWTAPGR